MPLRSVRSEISVAAVWPVLTMLRMGLVSAPPPPSMIVRSRPAPRRVRLSLDGKLMLSSKNVQGPSSITSPLTAAAMAP